MTPAKRAIASPPSHPLRARRLGAVVAAALTALGAGPARAANAIAMHGEPAMTPGFTHFHYVNPNAPKGGRLTEGIVGTFNSLNPLIVMGDAVSHIRGYVIESLMARGYDEPFTLYGLIAQSVETDAARSFVAFTLNPAARFSDGHRITPQDVVFSWRLLRDKGRPNLRLYYAKVKKAEIVGDNAVRFDLAGANDRELPLILALMPILPQHAIDEASFDKTTFTPPVGSGPYRVSAVEPGKSVTLKRDPNYWGRDLPVNRGQWNFDEIRLDYYRDSNSHFEAFKKGLFDVYEERDPGRWETAYSFPAARDGRVIKDAFATGVPKGMQAFAFNTRRSLFADIRVREAIGILFDFEWLNRNFYYGQFRRTASYFEGSELSARARKADAAERALLAPFPGAVRPDILDGTYQPPVGDGSGRDRDKLRRALALLKEAGYSLRGTQLVETATRRPFAFEILVRTKDEERLALAFSRDLKRAGIEAHTRLVDDAQYIQRLQTYDFDMIRYVWDESLSPGNEQAFYWGTAVADQPGTRNYMGAKNPAIDAMIAAMLKAKERPAFVSAVRALDRVLMSGFYVVPLFHLPRQWVARWASVEHPAATSLYGFLPETWWRKPGR